MPILSRIVVYPIKALPGVELESVRITEGGTLDNDRRWAMVDRKGRMINGKNNPAVFRLRPRFNVPAYSVEFVDVKGRCEQFELSCNAQLENYLSDQLNTAVSLKENTVLGFPDDPKAYGPTVISVASLVEVATWYPGSSLTDIRSRFRVNLEVGEAPAFWEDGLLSAERNTSFKIGRVLIEPTNACARCGVPMKSPETGKPLHSFYETFIQRREQAKPTWLDESCFNDWYKLSLNTKIPYQEKSKLLKLNDVITVV